MRSTTIRAMIKRSAMIEKYAVARMIEKHAVTKHAVTKHAVKKRAVKKYTVTARHEGRTFTIRAQSPEQAAQKVAALIHPHEQRRYVTDQLRVPNYVVKRGVFLRAA